MTRIGLVLGAGGVVGQAYHAGVLAALEHDLGWDPRSADLVVGSSAGSVTGTLLRLGVPASDLAAWAAEAQPSPEGRPVLELVGDHHQEFPAPSVADVLRGWRLPHRSLIAGALRRPLAFRPSVAAMTLMPAGRVDFLGRTSVLEHFADIGWPEGLWINAVRRDSGRRVVFGRAGAPAASMAHAVAASCAIPGYFEPVRIGGREFIDGGVHSPSNADVLHRERLDLVVVVSPMSSARRVRALDGGVRWRFHRQLMREVERLERTGTTVVRFEPRRRSLEAMGLNAMASDRSARVVREAFLDAGRLAARPEIRRRLDPVVDRSARGYRRSA